MADKYTGNTHWEAQQVYSGWQIFCPSRGVIAKEMNQGRDMGESDAKLIAAAPDLLEALTYCINNCDLKKLSEKFGGNPSHFATMAINAHKKANRIQADAAFDHLNNN